MKTETGQSKKRQAGYLENINRNAAGIDIGSRSHFVAVPPDVCENAVREFSTFTDSLNQLADWLVECRITTVAMESTGIYWIPVFEILESRGLDPHPRPVRLGEHGVNRLAIRVTSLDRAAVAVV